MSFNLEDAIKNWRRDLSRQQGLEPGMIEELEANLRDRIDEYSRQDISDKEAFEKAVAKNNGSHGGEEIANEFYKARTPIYKTRPPWKSQGEAKLFALLPSFLKVALRSFKRNKTYTLINYIGLTIGLLTISFVGLYINYELSWDRFHEHSDRIYRAGQQFRSQEYSVNSFDGYYSASRDVQLAQVQGFEDTRGVEEVAHFWIFGGASYLQIDDRRYSEDGLLTTNTPAAFFELFDWQFIHGSPRQFAETTNRAILTKTTAEKILPDARLPLSGLMNKTITIDSTDYQVAGIINDIPSNFHFEFKIALHDPKIEYWGGRTYALFEEGADPQAVKQRWEANIESINPRLASETELFNGFAIHNLEDIHLHADLLYEVKPPGNPFYLWVFGIIGGIILLITFTNYTNLSIAMYSGRNREIGMRKVLGAARAQISGQFLLESVLLSLFTIPVVMAGLTWLLPYFNDFMGVEIADPVSISHLPSTILILLTFSVAIGIIAGIYPAFVMSGRSIRNLFQKQSTKPAMRGVSLRKGLITFQFVLLIGLGSVTYFINNQLEYIQQKDIGYEKEGIVYVLMEEDEDYEQFKNKLAGIPGVNHVGTGSTLARSNFNQVTYKVDGIEQVFDDGYTLEMTPGAIRAYGIETSVDEMLADTASMPEELVVINETGAQQFANVLGVEKHELIGRTYRTEPSYTQDDGTQGFPYTIDGFFEDINMFSLRQEIDPYFLRINANFRGPWAIVNFNESNFSGVMDEIEAAYDDLGQSFPFITRFQDDRLANLYEQDRRVGTLTIYLSVLAFLVAVLGLIGLAAYLTTLRKKEIGVRRVLGASVWQILYRMNREYLYLIAISLCIAAPFAYLAVEQWLSGFAFRIGINLLVFPAVALLTLLIATLAVSSQTLRAVTDNPVESLRNEQ